MISLDRNHECKQSTAQQNAAYVGIVNSGDWNTTMAMKVSLVVNALVSSSTELHIDPLINNLQLFLYVISRHIFKWLHGFHSRKWMPMKYYWCIYIFNDRFFWSQYERVVALIDWLHWATVLAFEVSVHPAVEIHYRLNGFSSFTIDMLKAMHSIISLTIWYMCFYCFVVLFQKWYLWYLFESL